MFFAGERRKGKLANLRRKKFFLTLTLSLSLSLRHTRTYANKHSYTLTLSSFTHSHSFFSVAYTFALFLSLTLSLSLSDTLSLSDLQSEMDISSEFSDWKNLLHNSDQTPSSIFNRFQAIWAERERKKERRKKIWDKSRRSTLADVVVARATAIWPSKPGSNPKIELAFLSVQNCYQSILTGCWSFS